MPQRGDSLSYDYEVSRALEDRMMKSLGDDVERVIVVRGSSGGNEADVVMFTLPSAPPAE